MDYHWLCDRLRSWDDPRYASRMTEDYVEKLVALHRDGEALEMVARRRGEDASFRPKSALSTLRLAQLASQGGSATPLARELLADFGARFASDPSVAAADKLAKQLGA